MLAFTKEEKEKITSQLISIAYTSLRSTSYKKIKVEDLAKAAGISKGTFYHFFSSKEQLFYEVMIHTHHQLYGDAIQYLFNKELPPEERLTKAIYQSVLTLHESGLWDFWQKDAKEILPKVRPQHLQSQTEREEKLFSAFLQSCPPLKVSKELAIKSLQSLIYSSSLYLFYKEDYEQILPMLVKGVCGSIFD